MSKPDDYVVFYLGGIPFTAKELGNDILDEDLRTVFQTIIDRDMIPGVPPGTPWHDHIRLDGMESWTKDDGDSELIAQLKQNRLDAEQAYLSSYTVEARVALAEAHQRVKMATKLITE